MTYPWRYPEAMSEVVENEIAQYRDLLNSFVDSINSLEDSVRVDLGNNLLSWSANYALENTMNNPRSTVISESMRWFGQSLIDGQLNSTPYTVDGGLATAAGIEFATDAIVGMVVVAGIVGLGGILLPIPVLVIGGTFLALPSQFVT